MGGVGPTSFSSSDGCQPGTERTRMSLLYIYPCVGWDPGGWVPEEVGGSKGGGGHPKVTSLSNSSLVQGQGGGLLLCCVKHEHPGLQELGCC